jgi:hypothetical protein
LGEKIVTWTATDANGNSVSKDQKVIVRDTTLPKINITVTPDTLWPPNKKMIEIKTSVQVQDIFPVSVKLESIKCNEQDTNFVQGAEIGKEDYTFFLKSDREGKGNGRIYSITYSVTDSSGNKSTATTQVKVPHDMGNK